VHRHPLNAAPVDFAVRLATLGLKRRRATPRRRAVVVEVLTPSELERLIVRPSGLDLMQPLDLTLSRENWANLTRTDADGLHPASGAYWPHVLLAAGRSVFTSVALPMVKSA
jgi:hypothetical protein